VSEAGIQVTVVYSPEPRQVQEVNLNLSAGCTVLQALQASGLLQLYPSLDRADVLIGVWGRKASLKQTLRKDDRVEVYRALRVDPKVARRERFSKQGSRSAGLFSRKRVGAKAGY
jgi:putative ubiquitin-RnfH superfamily antitoxin RatB of RatAB toxin-antitoxin module